MMAVVSAAGSRTQRGRRGVPGAAADPEDEEPAPAVSNRGEALGHGLDAGSVQLHPGRSGVDHLRLQARAAGVDRSRVAEIVDAPGDLESKSAAGRVIRV